MHIFPLKKAIWNIAFKANLNGSFCSANLEGEEVEILCFFF